MVIRHINFDNNIETNWFELLQQYTTQYFDNLPLKKGYSFPPSNLKESIKNTTCIGEVTSFEEIIAFVANCLDTNGLQAASGSHCGYIPGGGLFENAIGNFVTSIGNYYSGVSFASPGAVALENEVLNWVCGIVGYDKNAKGNITSGGSLANLTAITVAKKAKEITSKNIENCCIYLGEHTHHSVLKALKVSGLDEMRIRKIGLNKFLQLDIDKLQQQIEEDLSAGFNPVIIVSSAGTTNAGAIDDLSAINELSNKHSLWHHCDAAYGGFFVLTDDGRNQLNGLAQAHSITLDPHKGLFQSYGSGIVLVKNGELLANTFSEEADYMRDTLSDTFSPSDLSIELSRPFRALPLWVSLKAHGVAKFSEALEEKLQLTAYAYQSLKKMGFIIGPKPQLSVILFRLDDNDKTERLLKSIHNTCSVFLSSTHSSSHLWIRVAILSHRTSKKEVDTLLSFLSEWA